MIAEMLTHWSQFLFSHMDLKKRQNVLREWKTLIAKERVISVVHHAPNDTVKLACDKGILNLNEIQAGDVL